MNTPADVVTVSPGLASWVALCLAHRSSAWITLRSRLQRRCGLDPWCLSAGICGQLHKVAPFELDFCFQDYLLPLKKPWVSTIPRPFVPFSPFFLLLYYFQDILPFVFCNLLEMRRICMASALQISMQLLMLFMDQDRLQMEFVQ